MTGKGVRYPSLCPHLGKNTMLHRIIYTFGAAEEPTVSTDRKAAPMKARPFKVSFHSNRKCTCLHKRTFVDEAKPENENSEEAIADEAEGDVGFVFHIR